MYEKIASQNDLDKINKYDWNDSELISGEITSRPEENFPKDINYSGYIHPNYHLIYRTFFAGEKIIELVYVNCDHINAHFIERPFFTGKVTSLANVEIFDRNNSLVVRMDALLYREISHSIIR
jgi:hypothetical protein